MTQICWCFVMCVASTAWSSIPSYILEHPKVLHNETKLNEGDPRNMAIVD